MIFKLARYYRVDTVADGSCRYTGTRSKKAGTGPTGESIERCKYGEAAAKLRHQGRGCRIKAGFHPQDEDLSQGGSAPMHPEGMQEQGCGSYQETVAPEALKACSRWLSEATPPERSIHDAP